MKPAHDALLERFRQVFPKAAIQIEDESHWHVGHVGASGGAGHFRVRVIDARFNGLQRISRHRLVYDAVSDWMPARVHALNIIAMTLEEAGTLVDHPILVSLETDPLARTSSLRPGAAGVGVAVGVLPF